MLKGLDKRLTGDLLKILCDMGHGDELVIADANFPAETCARRLIRFSGVDGVAAAKAILSVFPLDTYAAEPALVMDLTEGDKGKGSRHLKSGAIMRHCAVRSEKSNALLSMSAQSRHTPLSRPGRSDNTEICSSLKA